MKALIVYIYTFFVSLIFPVKSEKINISPTITSNPLPTVINNTGLPDYHLIKAAFVPQSPEKNWDQPWQDACEEASLLTVHYYYTHRTPTIPEILNDYHNLFDIENQLSYSHDINLEKMAEISKTFLNLQPNIITDPQVEDIKKYLSQNIPIIITANGKTLYQENKHFKGGGPWYHSLVILGYDDHNSKFIVHDVGTQFGAYFQYSYSLLMQAIHDFPNSNIKEDIDKGDKKVLVLVQ